MRSFISHQYEDIKLDVIWTAVTNELEPLVQAVEQLAAKSVTTDSFQPYEPQRLSLAKVLYHAKRRICPITAVIGLFYA